jgi:hypothetical protein
MRLARIVLVTLVAGLALLPALASAQETPAVETRTVGPYEISVRYAEKPLLEVENKLLIDVRDGATGAPVTGLEDDILLRGRVVESGVQRGVAVAVRAAPGQPGLYEGIFVAPAIGEYQWRITGDFDGTPVDETFVSGSAALPEIGVPGRDYSTPGAFIAVATLGAYLVGLVVIGVWMLRKRSRSRAVTAGP